MKRFLLIMLAFCLVCAVACAEVKTVNTSYLSLNRMGNTFVIRNDNRMYQVVDANLNPLSREYPEISDFSGSGLYIIKSEAGQEGLLSMQGELLINPQYDDISILSDRWFAGITLKDSTAENYDYKSFGSDPKFYLVDTVDIYYGANRLHTFSRMDYDSANAYGDYLIVQNREKKNTAYNKDFTLSSFEPESFFSEYNENWNTGRVTHVGSGQEAFTAGCTLTADEVQTKIWIKENRLVDLQGNELADLRGYNYKTVDKDSNLVRVEDNYDKYGLLDSEGKELLPCAYDGFGYDLKLAMSTGYLYAVKDGKAGFVSLKDGSEKGFGFLESAGNQRSSFIVIEDPREGTILISAAAGELPGRYKSAEVPYSSAAMYATVEEMDGRIHVIDVYGSEMLEDNPEIKYTSDVNYSNDGTIILVRDIEQVYHIYHVDPTVYIPTGATAASDDTQPAGTAASDDTQPTGTAASDDTQSTGTPSEDDGTWTCENGHESNTGKFCTECGAKKPEQDSTWTCENGHAGNTGKFCSECGAKKPE